MGRPAVATVGRIQAFPGGTNIIPGRCDSPSTRVTPSPSRASSCSPRSSRSSTTVARERDLDVEIEVITDHDPVPLQP